MADAKDPSQPLRAALSASPDNVPLRRLLASTLSDAGRFEEAEAELRQALRLAPKDEVTKVELARVFRYRGKHSEAAVLLEALISSSDHPAQAYIEHAWLLAASNDPARASRQYHKAIELDPDLRDSQLEEQLEITSEPDPTVSEDGRMREPGDAEPDATPFHAVTLERPETSFADIGGMDALKEQVRMKIILPIERPDIFAAFGKKVGGGLLMYGPPGCGKTNFARATAGQVKAAFIPVSLHDTLSMWIGESEKRLHMFFEVARRNAPSVLFFDEVDALGAKRSDFRGSHARQTINQFLDEMDGVRSGNDGVLILAATNAPWHLDSAFLRPGRFDEILFVPPPDELARRAILEIQLRDKPKGTIDIAAIAQKTEGFSGADLKAVVEKAIEPLLLRSLEKGRIENLTTKDLVEAIKARRISTKEWFATARSYALYSNEDGLYDPVLNYLKLR